MSKSVVPWCCRSMPKTTATPDICIVVYGSSIHIRSVPPRSRRQISPPSCLCFEFSLSSMTIMFANSRINPFTLASFLFSFHCLLELLFLLMFFFLLLFFYLLWRHFYCLFFFLRFCFFFSLLYYLLFIRFLFLICRFYLVSLSLFPFFQFFY